MGKILTIIIGVYILYYLANIIYDLFVKKETVVAQENVQTFSIGDAAEKDNDSLQNVSIDEVENLKTPMSFNNMAYDISTAEENNSSVDNEFLRRKFEDEQNIDNYLINIPKETTSSTIKTSTNSVRWEDILNEAKTRVHLVKNLDGYKVYKSFN